MDDITFTFISAMAAAGGALGTLVGYRKLLSDRQSAKQEISIPNIARSPYDMTIKYAHDFTRTIGYLGMHSLYGMVVYPWMPLYLIGGSVRKDMNNRFIKRHTL